jgi:phosphocarrier protein HPr
MPETTVTRTVVVTDPAGVHLRSALAIAQTVRRGSSHVTIVKGPQRVNAADTLQVTTLVAEQGDGLTLEAAGKDADAVLDAIELLLAGRFTEGKNKDRTQG